jgi:very-short-patch-repair endonuclease
MDLFLESSVSSILNESKRRQREIYYQNLKDMISKIEKPTRSKINAKKGISENFFLSAIKGHKLLEDFTIELNNNLSSFSPDFTFIHKSGLYIDVEIDEPYVGHSKEVIHYYDTNTSSFNDEFRNNFFKESGWIVIRFSEKQIITNPIGCLQYIVAIVEDTLNMSYTATKKYSFIQEEKVWSKQIADEMAEFDYRKTYLPVELYGLFN